MSVVYIGYPPECKGLVKRFQRRAVDARRYRSPSASGPGRTPGRRFLAVAGGQRHRNRPKTAALLRQRAGTAQKPQRYPRRLLPAPVPWCLAVAATQVSNAVIDEMQLIGAEVLGRLLGRPAKSIRVDIHRRPETLPPRFVIPGTRKLLWRTSDVKRWMDDLAEAEVDRIALKKRAAKQASRY